VIDVNRKKFFENPKAIRGLRLRSLHLGEQKLLQVETIFKDFLFST
jgi:hypothetical protein